MPAKKFHKKSRKLAAAPISLIPKLTPTQARLQRLGFAQLPLSERIKIAVADARKVFRSGWSENMGVWINRAGSADCACCFAGACMIATGGVRTDALSGPLGEINDPIRKAFEELNLVRGGAIGLPAEATDAACQAVRSANRLIHSNYNIDKDRAPWKIYLEAAKILAEAGL